jgi:hypothetical protein
MVRVGLTRRLSLCAVNEVRLVPELSTSPSLPSLLLIMVMAL